MISAMAGWIAVGVGVGVGAAVGGTVVAVGGAVVIADGKGVAVGRMAVAVGGTGELVGARATAAAVGVIGIAEGTGAPQPAIRSRATSIEINNLTKTGMGLLLSHAWSMDNRPLAYKR